MSDYVEPDLTGRPRPVNDAAVSVSKVLGIIGALVTTAVTYGIITSVQGDAVTGLLGLIPGAITAVLAAYSAFRVAAEAEPQVTPVSKPVVVINGEQVPLVPATGPTVV